MVTVNAETFYKHVPAFRSPDARIFEAAATQIETASAKINALVGGADLDAPAASLAERCICLEAAAAAIPHLDLVLTQTGFGVVSNQNVAPASRERVEALLSRITEDYGDALDGLRFALLERAPAATSAVAGEVGALVWCPTLARRYGITLAGKRVGVHEFEALRPAIGAAEAEAALLLSPELYAKLVALQRGPYAGMAPAYRLAFETACRLVALLVTEAPPRSVETARRALQDTLHRFAVELPEYQRSTTCAAETAPRHENRKQDGTFFFS